MYKGKHSKDKKHRLTPLAALALALMLVLSVGGTVAYLATSAGPVVNTFTPGKTGITITEKFEQTAKSSIQVTAGEDSVPVYVRIMLVATYQKEDGSVCATHPAAIPEDLLLGTNWVKRGGYYYYKSAISAGGSTGNLLGENLTLDQHEGCCVMHIEVLAQSIQAEPDDAIKNAWKIDPDSWTVITD